MSTGLKASQVHDRKMLELYAADAGVEHAIWNIQNDNQNLPAQAGDVWEYDILDANGKTVHVTIEYIDNQTDKITSTATSDTGLSTTVESYVSLPIVDFSYLLDNTITSIGDVTIQPNSSVEGDVQDNGELDNKGTITGNTSTENITSWPTSEQLSGFYWEDVKDLEPYDDDTIDIKHTDSIGPTYRDGSLTIKNTGKTGPKLLTITGTLYVTGDLVFQQPGGPEAYTVNLNGQTIYVEGTIYFPPQFCTISGSGCIIAVGAINFQPQVSTSNDDFLFVMSIEDTVAANPGGSFHGSMAGSVVVDLQPNCTLTWTEPPDGLNFPYDGGSRDIEGKLEIRTYTIQ